MSAKLDLYKQHAAEYAARKQPSIIKTEPAQYLTIEGSGDPGGKQFQDCIGALYAIAFTTKMAKKFAGHDYHVCKLEGLWWENPRGGWYWKLMIRTPEFIRDKDIRTAIDVALARGRHSLVEDVKLEIINEGAVVQALHVGPYQNVSETIRVMEEVAAEQGFKFDGLHHEIYLSDPRRVAPDRLKTIVRHPVVRSPRFGHE